MLLDYVVFLSYDNEWREHLSYIVFGMIVIFGPFFWALHGSQNVLYGDLRVIGFQRIDSGNIYAKELSG